MSELLLYYRRPEPTTWVYMSSFLTLGIYLVFHRLWSIRNLDIALLILLAPGLLMVHEGQRRSLQQRDQIAIEIEQADVVATSVADADTESTNVPSTDSSDSESTRLVTDDDDTLGADSIPSGSLADATLTDSGDSSEGPIAQRYSWIVLKRSGYIWLFLIEAFLLLRLLLDPLMVRRPMLDPNLTTGGLNFIGISLFIFMMANVVTSTPRIQEEQGPQLGPGYALMNMLPAIPTRPISDSVGGDSATTIAELTPVQQKIATLAKVIAILAQLSIVVAIVMIGKRHFNNLCAGTGCALLYLLLPYTAQMTGRVDHALPAALLLWAVLTYRRPVIAGIFLGLAAGLVYYPLFLLPLWFSFYWQRGARRFAIGVASMLVLLMLMLSLGGTESLLGHLQRMFGLRFPTETPQGIWELGFSPVWRLPVIVAFVILSIAFAIWPAQKNLGTLISCTAALMVGAQFWHGYGGGMYIAWFLPLLLLTIFRPNLQDRVALKVIRPHGASSRRIDRIPVNAA